MRTKFMRASAWIALALAITAQAGCTLGLRDALQTGVYDFVASTVTETLGSLVFAEASTE